MPNIAPEWEVNKEADEIISKLISMYPDKLGHIDPDQVAAAFITNKERPDSAKWFAKIVSAKAPLNLFSTKQYVIYCFKNTWDEFSRPQRSIMLMDMLLRIPEEMDGSLLQDDLKGLKVLVKKFGVDFIDNPNLPDVADARQIF